MPKKKAKRLNETMVGLQWNIPADMVGRYATNIVVQHSANEFTLSFFEARPPFMLGAPEEIQKILRETTAVEANCIARVVIAPAKMREFVQVATENLEKYTAKFGVKQ